MNKLEVKKVYDGEYLISRTKFRNFDSIYLNTTENIGGYMPDMKGEKVLTVASSGDHYFNALAMGASSVDVFDINTLAINILKLKKAAIENFDIETYYSFIGINKEEDVLNYELYKKIRDFLDKNTREFFDYVYLLSNNNGINLYSSSLFLKPYSLSKKIKNANPYLEEKNYNKIQKKLKNIKNIKFYNKSVEELYNGVNKKYNKIFLSNIQDYSLQKKHIEDVLDLDVHLKENGKIYIAYLYNYLMDNNRNLYETLSKKEEFKGIIIDSIDNYIDDINIKDKVFIYRKI